MGKAISAITGGSKSKVEKIALPPIKKPAEMPDEEALKRQAAIAEAKKKSGGRQSTILTDYEESLG